MLVKKIVAVVKKFFVRSVENLADDLKSLSEIFSGNNLFRIPDYQRGYAWQDKQLIEFWDDIRNLKDNSGKDDSGK